MNDRIYDETTLAIENLVTWIKLQEEHRNAADDKFIEEYCAKHGINKEEIEND